jgi:hypothetical protein
MEPEGSLPPSQEPSTGPYPEPDRSNPHHPILSLLMLYTVEYKGSIISQKVELGNFLSSMKWLYIDMTAIKNNSTFLMSFKYRNKKVDFFMLI